MAEGSSASSLEAGFIELAGIVRALHGDWSAPAAGYDGWTCHDLLAHLSSTSASLASVASSSTQPARPDAPPFDNQRWNTSQVRKRADKDTQDLLDEYDMGTTHLVEVLSELDLDQKVTVGAYPGYTVRDAMAKMLEHQRHHLDDLRASLHAHPEL
jgi:Mycothiol maleylpyruvate isomerase N-terminal domain